MTRTEPGIPLCPVLMLSETKSFKNELSEMKLSDPDILVIRNSYLEAKFKLRNRNVSNNESLGNAAVLGLILLGNLLSKKKKKGVGNQTIARG